MKERKDMKCDSGALVLVGGCAGGADLAHPGVVARLARRQTTVDVDTQQALYHLHRCSVVSVIVIVVVVTAALQTVGVITSRHVTHTRKRRHAHSNEYRYRTAGNNMYSYFQQDVS